jgi:hypothetical protein
MTKAANDEFAASLSFSEILACGEVEQMAELLFLCA